MSMKNSLKVISLFSGLGGYEEALRKLGVEFEIVNFSEVDEKSIENYCLLNNVDRSKNLGDIAKINIEELPTDIDIILGSGPIQTFEKICKDKYGNLIRGESYSLSDYMVDICKHCNPKYILADRPCSTEKNPAYGKLISDLNVLGYVYNRYELSGDNHGLPLKQTRLFSLFVRHDIQPKLNLNIHLGLTQLEQKATINDILEPIMDILAYNPTAFLDNIVHEYDIKYIHEDTNTQIRSIEAAPYYSEPYVKITTDNGNEVIIKNVKKMRHGMVIVQDNKYRLLSYKECMRALGYSEQSINLLKPTFKEHMSYKTLSISTMVNPVMDILKQLPIL